MPSHRISIRSGSTHLVSINRVVCRILTATCCWSRVRVAANLTDWDTARSAENAVSLVLLNPEKPDTNTDWEAVFLIRGANGGIQPQDGSNDSPTSNRVNKSDRCDSDCGWRRSKPKPVTGRGAALKSGQVSSLSGWLSGWRANQTNRMSLPAALAYDPYFVLADRRENRRKPR